MKQLSPVTIGVLFTVLGFSTFAFTDVCVKVVGGTYDPFSVALYMNLATIFFMIPIILYCGGFKKISSTKSLKFHILRSYFMLINFVCVIYAFSQLPIATIYTILFTMPFMLSLFALVLFKEKISSHRWVAITLGFTGVLIAMRPGIEPISLAMTVTIIGTVFNASAATTVKFIDRKDHWLSYAFYMMLCQTPVLIAIALYRGEAIFPDLSDWSVTPWFIAAGIGFNVGLSLMPQALQRIDASIFGAITYIVFPWGIFYGYFIFNDVPDRWTITGAVIIILSGLYLAHREYTKKKQNAEN